MNNIYEIVKCSIDNKMKTIMSSSKYYLSEDNIFNISNHIYKKAIIVKNIKSDIKQMCSINNFDDYINIIKRGTISIYEPVDVNTDSFRIKLNNNSLKKSELFNCLVSIRNRFIEAGFITDIIKFDNCYGIKCISNKKYNTEKLYAFASEITNGLEPDLSDLKIGKIKRMYYSLNDDGSKDVIINIGQI